MKHTSFYLLLALLIIVGCTTATDVRQQTANHIARPAFMVERLIPANPFEFQAWERMHAPHQVATVYIEGDSVRHKSNAAEAAHNTPFMSATPKNPVALHLASRDLSKNLAYLARPCQYIKAPEKKGCDSSFWQEKRYSPEVIEAYETALDDMTARYNITGLHLVGYDGGANVAAVLAARRDDVLSLRTVAGDLNPDFTADNNGLTRLASNSMIATDYGTQLAKIPQHHFIGAADTIITPSIYHSYRQMVGISDCIHYSLVQDADHTRGWVDKWPELLTVEPQCAVVHKDLPPLPPPAEYVGQDMHKGLKAKYKK